MNNRGKSETVVAQVETDDKPVVANCPDCGWDFLADEPRDCPACKIGVRL